MYELLILGPLSRRPMHGYMIAKVIGKILGPAKALKWGALYPLLTRLETDGLICAAEDETGEDGRTRKVYSITDAGRARLRALVLDTEHHLADYHMAFAMKVSLFSMLTVEERIYLARHYAVHAQQQVDHFDRSRADVQQLDQSPEQIADILCVIDHNRQRWQSELAWAEELIARQHAQEAR